MERTFHVPGEDSGMRLDRFLSARAEGLSRSRIQALIASGFVLRNGQIPKAAEKLREGDTIVLRPFDEASPQRAEAEDVPVEILYEDEHLLALNKPAGMVVHPGAGNDRGTVVNALLHHCGRLSVIGGVERPGIVHRLDKETSGCLVVAKDDATHHALSRQFASREIRKVYLAVVIGRPRPPDGMIDAPITRHAFHRKQMTIARPGEGREAVTEYRTLATSGACSLVECRPKTGRTHQIRVHLKSLGAPVAGDAVYGKRGDFQRHLLHAWKIGLRHPSGRWLDIEAPIPPDFPLVPPPAEGPSS